MTPRGSVVVQPATEKQVATHSAMIVFFILWPDTMRFRAFAPSPRQKAGEPDPPPTAVVRRATDTPS